MAQWKPTFRQPIPLDDPRLQRPKTYAERKRETQKARRAAKRAPITVESDQSGIQRFEGPPPSLFKEEEEADIPLIKEEKKERYCNIKKRKRRRQSLSISVSEEEEDLLRRGAADAGMPFSAWARAVLFRAMRVAPPSRE